MIRMSATALLLLPVLGASEPAEAQNPIRDDNRAYSSTAQDRAYIAARCAALYSEMAQVAGERDNALAETKASVAAEFLKRVHQPSESVFLQWRIEYRAQLARQENPTTSLSGKDYEACSGVLLLIRNGDKMSGYSRDELKYLMGG